MTDDEHADDTTNSSDSEILVLAAGGRGSVFAGAVLVGISTFDAARTLAVRASGAFPDGGGFGALFGLVVFAVGVVFLVEGTAEIYAEK